MRKFRLIALAFVALLTLGMGGSALADGPSGSSEHHENEEGDTVFTNDVQCDGGEATPVGNVYVGDNGVEVCNEGDEEVSVVQGRVIVTSDDGGYIAADGDKDNVFEGDDTLTGYARINSDGTVQCSGEGDTSAPHAGTPGDGSTCGQ